MVMKRLQHENGHAIRYANYCENYVLFIFWSINKIPNKCDGTTIKVDIEQY